MQDVIGPLGFDYDNYDIVPQPGTPPDIIADEEVASRTAYQEVARKLGDYHWASLGHPEACPEAQADFVNAEVRTMRPPAGT